jgi:outer membrane receptor protein involved in Fe transport
MNLRKHIKYINKFAILASFTLLINQIGFSQNTGTITGTIVNNNIPIEYATVTLYTTQDSVKVIKAAITDSLGTFALNTIPFNDYILKVNIIGYLPYYTQVKIDAENMNISLRNTSLTQDIKVLKGAEFVVQKEFIKKTTSGFIIKAEDNITQNGGTATDLLRNAPTVVVDAENGITIRGKTPLILINGRNSSIGSTDRIPASAVESIEIINNPSSKYDADSDGGVIIITLKKNGSKGFNGSATLGGGFGDRGRVNSSLILNYQTGKWNVGFSYDNRFAGRTRKIEANRTNFDLPNEYYLLQNRFDERFEQTQNFKLNIDFSPNNKNTFNFEALCNVDGVDNNETLTSMFRTDSNAFNNKNSRNSIEIVREVAAEFAFYYTRKFNNPGKLLSASVTSSFNWDKENTDIRTQSLYEGDSLLGSPFLQQTHNYQNSNVTNIRFDYTIPLSQKSIFEMGYKGILRFTNADFQRSYFDSVEYIKDPATSNVFNFQEQVHAVYLQYSGYVGKQDSARFSYEIGMRVEQVYNYGGNGNNSSLVNRQYANFFPAFNMAYFFNSRDFIKLSFSRRINRPGLSQLNPFIDITDSLNQHGGNLSLKPELINAIELGYNKEWKKISFSTNLFFRYATDIIRPYIVLNNNGVALTTPINFGDAITFGIEGIASFYPFKFWSANISASCYQQNISGSAVNSTISNNVFSWYGKLINNFTLWKGSKLQIIGNYNSPVGTPQGQRIAIYYFDLGFQQKILKGKWAFGLVVTDVFNTQKNGYSATSSNFSYNRSFKIDTRAVMLTVAFSFGATFKEEVLENKFKND